MWDWVGVALGVALALGFAGHRGQHWAVRVLCLFLFVVGGVGGLVVGLFGGSGSVVFGLSLSAVLAFCVVSVGLGVAWLPVLWDAAQRQKKMAFGVVAGVALLAGLLGFGVSSVFVDPPVAESVALPVVAPVVAVSCLCGSGNICTGERGGRYCITEAGKKQYQARE